MGIQGNLVKSNCLWEPSPEESEGSEQLWAVAMEAGCPLVFLQRRAFGSPFWGSGVVWGFFGPKMPLVSFSFQSLEEVCDLLHAAPFQNILPRVHVKGIG